MNTKTQVNQGAAAVGSGALLGAAPLWLREPKNNAPARFCNPTTPDHKTALLNRGEDHTLLSGIEDNHPNNASPHRIDIGDAMLAESSRHEQGGLKARLLSFGRIAKPRLDQDSHIPGALGITFGNLSKIIRHAHK